MKQYHFVIKGKAMVNLYLKLNEQGRVVFLFIAFSLFGALLSLFFLLLPSVGIGGFLGYLLGAGVALINYFLLRLGYGHLLDHNGPKAKTVLIGLGSMLARFALDAGALVLAAFCTFKWGNHFLNFWFVFVSMLPIYPIMIVVFLKERKKEAK